MFHALRPQLLTLKNALNLRPLPALLVIAVTAAAWWIAPSPPRLGPETTGDAELARQLHELAGERGYRGLSVALIEDGRVRTAGIGNTGGADPRPVDAHTAYELGSITKGLTGMLLAESGLDPDTPVAQLLPQVHFADPAVGGATLAELASHRSGLPRLGIGPGGFLDLWLAGLTGANPYRKAQALPIAAAARAGEKGSLAYSNLGAALLGQALAQHANTSYAELLSTKILQPLNMLDTTVVDTPAALPENRARGATAGGLAAAPWYGGGWEGAGIGVWSSAADITVLLQALMDGSAPGADAATPRYQAGRMGKIGFGWITTQEDEREITWHDGGTGGFSSYTGFDPASGRGVVVLGNTDKSVAAIGLQLLGIELDKPEQNWLITGLALAFALFCTLYGTLLLLTQQQDKLELISALSMAVFLLMLARSFDTWHTLPPVLWLLGVALTAAGAIKIASNWRTLPLKAKGRLPIRVIGAAFSLILCSLSVYGLFYSLTQL